MTSYKMAALPIYGKIVKKILFSRTEQPVSLSPKYKRFSMGIYRSKYNDIIRHILVIFGRNEAEDQ